MVICVNKLECLKSWWDHLNHVGSNYGYYPKAAKMHLIIKKPELQQKTEELFSAAGVKITSEGKCHIGAVIGIE